MQQLAIPGVDALQRPRRGVAPTSLPYVGIWFSRDCGQITLVIYLDVKLIAKEKGPRVTKERGQYNDLLCIHSLLFA